MKQNLSLIVLISIGLGPCILSNNIFVINSFSEVQEELEKADKDTWVLFDIDHTLLIPNIKNLWPKTYEMNVERITAITNELYVDITHEQYKILQSKRFAAEQQLLIEPAIVDIISSLQNRGVKILGLTARASGAYGAIQFFPELTYSQLLSKKIDFDKFRVSHVILDGLHQYQGDPVFFRGILSTNRIDKGEVLTAFLDRVQDGPGRVIFFDDLVENVESVVHALNMRGISCKGFVYKGADLLVSSFNEKVFHLQHKHLIEHGEWLGDDEAEEMLFHAQIIESLVAKLAL